MNNKKANRIDAFNTKSTQKSINLDLKNSSEKIYDFYHKNFRMPSYAEICKLCDLKSKNTAHNLVKKLQALGYINTDKTGKIIPALKKIPVHTTRSVAQEIQTSSLKNKTQESPLILLGLVEAGFPTPSEESLHENISLDDWVIEKKEASFMLKVKGDSMKDAGILDGDMVIVERTSSPKVGQIVVAEVDGSYTMKYLKKDSSGRSYLEPANSDFKAIYPKQNLQISAVVKAVVRKYR
jgi:repressor LexA